MTNRATSNEVKAGMMTVRGKGRGMNIATSESAAATSRIIDINLADHFTFSRLIFIVASV